MKTRLLGLLLLITLTASCQEYKREIENSFSKYSNSTKNEDFKDLMNYIPEEYFNVYPKDKMILALEKEAKNPETESELKEQTITKIGGRELVDGKYYALLTYSKKMKIRYNRKNDNKETDDDYKTRVELTKSLFETKYGQTNVSFDETTRFFEIDSEEQVYAISDNGETNWKFVSIDEERSILETIIPAKLVERL